jgi:uncharacterized protein DUF1559
MTSHRPVPGSTEHKVMRRRQLGCIAVGLAMLSGLLFVTAYVGFFRSIPLRISKETTYVTAPLKSDGKRVDYFAAWEQETYPKNIATEENGYRLIVEHLGGSPDAPAEHAARVCRKLGLPGEPRPDMTFEEPDGFLEAYLDSDEFDEALIDVLMAEDPQRDPEEVLTERAYRPWTLDDLPMMERWLEENGPTLDLIAEATRRPTFRMPFARKHEDEQLISLLLPEVQYTRAFARGLSVRAHFRIGTGDIDGAIDDVLACKRHGRQVAPGGCLVQVLVGIAIEGIADGIGIAGSLEHPPTKQQLERLVAGLNDLPPESEFAEALQFERYMTLDFVQAMATGTGSLEDWGLPSGMPREIGLDWNLIARRINGYFDTLPDGSQFMRPAWRWEALVSVRARSEMYADMIAALTLPAWDAAEEATRRRTCVDRVHRITLAMLLYECDHGTLPLAYTIDTDGKPMHSWRVLLLPYLGQQELHDKICLDEPWDSEHNRQFHRQAIEFYQCPSKDLKPGQTTYSVVVGPETPFQAGPGKALSDFGPKSAGMILVVERNGAGCWMDPAHDVSQQATEEGVNALHGTDDGIGSPHPGGANFGFRDGGVRFFSETADIEVLKKLLRGATDRIP